MSMSVQEKVEWIFKTSFEQDQISRREYAFMLMVVAVAEAVDDLRSKTDPQQIYQDLNNKLKF